MTTQERICESKYLAYDYQNIITNSAECSTNINQYMMCGIETAYQFMVLVHFRISDPKANNNNKLQHENVGCPACS